MQGSMLGNFFLLLSSQSDLSLLEVITSYAAGEVVDDSDDANGEGRGLQATVLGDKAYAIWDEEGELWTE